MDFPAGEYIIPAHMAHMDRVGGLPVPKIVVPMRVGRIDLAPSTWPGFDLMTVWVSESGPPDFGKYDEELHRQCMAQYWCHVCGLPSKHLLICVPTALQTREVNGRSMALAIQPWVCAGCLAYATRSCPPLWKAIEEGRGFVISGVPARSIVQTQWKPANEDDPIPPEGARVLSSHKIAIPDSFLGHHISSQPLAEWAHSIGNRHWRRWKRGSGLA